MQQFEEVFSHIPRVSSVKKTRMKKVNDSKPIILLQNPKHRVPCYLCIMMIREADRFSVFFEEEDCDFFN
jgi:hypothetical protein